MKTLVVGVLFFALVCSAYGISIDQIVKLSKLKAGDDLILQLIQKEKLDKPITTKDVLYLKQQGVSDRVIAYLMKLSDTKGQKMPPQEGQSIWISENLRAYYTTTKDGKKVKVITNLDENGKRLGGELPPEAERKEVENAYQRSEPKEINVYVRQEEPQQREPEEYVEQPPQRSGIPPYNTYYPSYYPYYSIPYSFPTRSRFRTMTPNQMTTIGDARTGNLVRPRPAPPPTSPPNPSFGGVRHLRR